MKKVEAVEAVKKFLLEGHADTDIREYLAGEKFKPAVIAGVLREAWDEIARAADVPPEDRKAWAVEAMRDLYRRMLSSGDFAGARSVLNDFVKLTGIAKVEIESKPETPSKPAKDNVFCLKLKK